jgi:hypothetical protein
MFIGVIVMLIARALYNSAPIVLRTATRSLPNRSGPAFLRAVLTRRVGLIGLALEVLGWSLEVVALDDAGRGRSGGPQGRADAGGVVRPAGRVRAGRGTCAPGTRSVDGAPGPGAPALRRVTPLR